MDYQKQAKGPCQDFKASWMIQRGLEEAIGSSPSLRSSAVIKIPRLEGQEELAAELEKVSRTCSTELCLSDPSANQGKQDIPSICLSTSFHSILLRLFCILL